MKPTRKVRRLVSFTALLCLPASPLISGSLRLPGGKLHLRSGPEREWSSFPPVSADGRSVSVPFEASSANSTEYSLIVRQLDVKKANWAVSVNGRKLGVLQDDERGMVRVLAVPAGAIRSGDNTVEVAGDASGTSDDITISEMRLEPVPVRELLTEATISIAVTPESMPVKITIVDSKGSLIPFTSLRTDAYEATRTGVLYSADGVAKIGVPAGEYRVYASRGFEYNAPNQRVQVSKGGLQAVRLALRREVSLQGYVSCDPHVHTFELSRHGDASVDERVLTAAGEGLDIIVATEHNRVDDYSPVLKQRALDRWTLAVPGSEVTTAMGHFNIFPVTSGKAPPDHRVTDWRTLMDSIWSTDGVQVVVQNHPRDLHLKYRPFDPAHHLSATGTNTNGRPFRANAMEVVNSGAMSTDVMQLVRDWLGLLTRGLKVAAIGSSDTHTVDFVPIGQARTYIQAPREKAFEALAEGRNLVSYGLATELSAKPDGTVDVAVHGPSWSSVDRVEIYSNGRIVWTDSFAPRRSAGVKYRRAVKLTLPRHDTAIAAVASGPGVLEPFWEVRKPYQPRSPDWTPRVLGVSSAVWIDVDGDGRITSPREYAEKLADQPEKVATYDPSVWLHAEEIRRTARNLRE